MTTNAVGKLVELSINEMPACALDWCVLRAQGFSPAKREKRKWGYAVVPAPELVYARMLLHTERGMSVTFDKVRFSTDPNLAYTIIERERISVIANIADNFWMASCRSHAAGNIPYAGHGDTVLLAAMRSYVMASVNGKSTFVPVEVLA